eukprot:CAMPEP_0114152210 /NCGR_PEP_ID=MMETSP0043_2-20121206/23678_1 /TAXON_ID=464988 /ORGANISM="Hemiselmis andersenii, Strain CCMP644" /LENGTH=232 /DNA_ID=CAMNT_0001247119 /DNA_START=44 /DNA_END=744 /DNA_ORIENTATION=-
MNVATAGAIASFMGLTYAFTLHKLKHSVAAVAEFSDTTPAKMEKRKESFRSLTNAASLLRPCRAGASLPLRHAVLVPRARGSGGGKESDASTHDNTTQGDEAGLGLRGGGGGDDGDEDTRERDQQLIQQLQQMRSEVSAVSERIESIEREMEEHTMAAEALAGLDESRPCHRAVGGVLTEQTVGDVRPSLLKELEMLAKARTQLVEKLRQAEADMAAFQKEHKIKIMPSRDS